MTPIRSARVSREQTLRQVATELGIDPSTLAKIERGAQTPSRETARRIFEFYDGEIPLGAIYDPDFYASTAEEASAA